MVWAVTGEGGGLPVIVSPSQVVGWEYDQTHGGSSLVIKSCLTLCDAIYIKYIVKLFPLLATVMCQEVCNFLGSVSPQQRFEMVDRCYSFVTAQFYLASKGYYALEVWGQADPKGETSIVLASSFYTFVSSLPWACSIQIGLAKKEVCFFFTWSSHSHLWIFFCSVFAGFSLSLSFSHRHFGLLFPILTT